MEEEDDFPFESIDAFEKAVEEFFIYPEDERNEPVPMFAMAPPIHVDDNINQPSIKSLGEHLEECRLRSPSAKSTTAIRELTEEVRRIEMQYQERIEQLESLYFYLYEKIKLLEKK